MVGNNQAREADIRALSELTRALDKKVIIFSMHVSKIYLVIFIEMEIGHSGILVLYYFVHLVGYSNFVSYLLFLSDSCIHSV